MDFKSKLERLWRQIFCTEITWHLGGNNMNIKLRESEEIYEIGRRDFLKKTMMLAALPLLGGIGLAPTVAQAFVPPVRARGTTVKNVRDFGALGNGVHDDTDAIQKAISALPSDGGTVVIPAGNYMINAVKSIYPKNYTYIQIDPSATLNVIPNSSDGYAVFFLDSQRHDIEISGGKIVGDRLKHKGTTGEGGHCIRVHGAAHVTIRDITLMNGWGDGITVGPGSIPGGGWVQSKDIVLNNVICDNNRRNGLSVGNVVGMKVFNSQFLRTNGTAPQCGVDVEPNDTKSSSTNFCQDVWFEACLFAENAKYGINVWANARNLTITKCNLERNNVCGIVTRNVSPFTFTENSVNNNMSTGVFLQTGTANANISGNTFFRNYLKQTYHARAPFCASGLPKGTAKDMLLGTGTSGVTIATNCYK
jgi:polygalacturonase